MKVQHLAYGGAGSGTGRFSYIVLGEAVILLNKPSSNISEVEADQLAISTAILRLSPHYDLSRLQWFCAQDGTGWLDRVILGKCNGTVEIEQIIPAEEPAEQCARHIFPDAFQH